MNFGILIAAGCMLALVYVTLAHILPMMCFPASSGTGKKKQKATAQKAQVVPIERKRKSAS